MTEPTGKLHESNPHPSSPPPRQDKNHKDPAQQANVAHYLALANIWLVWSPSFIWHFPFHNALSSTELRILLSYRNLLRNFSGGVGERTQNKLSNGICVILHKVQVILERMEWKWNIRLAWVASVMCIKSSWRSNKSSCITLLKYVTFHCTADSAEVTRLVFLSSQCMTVTTRLAEGPARAVQHLAAISLLNCSLIGPLLRLITLTNAWLPTERPPSVCSAEEPLGCSPAAERQSYTEETKSVANTLVHVTTIVLGIFWTKAVDCRTWKHCHPDVRKTPTYGICTDLPRQRQI